MTVFAHTAAMQHNVGSSVRVWRRELSSLLFHYVLVLKWNTHVWEIIASFDFKRGISGNTEDFRPTGFQRVSFKRLVLGIALLRLPMCVDDQTTSKKSIRLYVTWYYVDINASHHRTLPLCWSCPNTFDFVVRGSPHAQPTNTIRSHQKVKTTCIFFLNSDLLSLPLSRPLLPSRSTDAPIMSGTSFEDDERFDGLYLNVAQQTQGKKKWNPYISHHSSWKVQNTSWESVYSLSEDGRRTLWNLPLFLASS